MARALAASGSQIIYYGLNPLTLRYGTFLAMIECRDFFGQKLGSPQQVNS